MSEGLIVERGSPLVQFEIRASDSWKDDWMPRVIWVDRTLRPKTNFVCVKCSEVFRVLDESVKSLYREIGRPCPRLNESQYMAVCRCMGRFIE